MKKFASIVIAFLFFNSCSIHKNNKPIESVQVKSKEIMDSIVFKKIISDNKLDTSILKIHFQYYINPECTVQDSVNKQIAKIVMDKTNFEKVEKVPIKLNNEFFVKQLNIFYNDALFDYQKKKYKYLWEFEMDISIDLTYKYFTSVYINSSIFVGKESSEKQQFYYHFSNLDGRMLNQFDFFDTTKFTLLAENYFKEQNNILLTKNYNELGFWFENNKFQLSPNFFIENGSINFFYNQYEIAPYSFGNIIFYVPLSNAKPFLKIDLTKN